METNRKTFLVPFFAILFIFSVVGVASLMNNNPNQGNSLGNSINYGADVQVFTTGDFEGRETPLGEMELVNQGHNVLYDTGEEVIEQYLGAGAGGGDAFDWIEMCNATAGCGEPVAGKTEAHNAFAGCGLENVVGSYSSIGNGNWSISKTFTATCDALETNMTRLRNDDDDDLAGNNFTLVTLQNGDTLLLNWTIYVT